MTRYRNGISALLAILKANVPIGEIHHWADGDYTKTPAGWRQVKKDIQKHLQQHTEKYARSSEKGLEHRDMATVLRERIKGLETALEERPDHPYLTRELSEAKKKLVFHTVRAEESGSRAYKRASEYIDSVKQYLKDHHQADIASQFQEGLKKLTERLQALQEGGTEYNAILERHAMKIGSKYEDSADAESGAADEIAMETDEAEAKLQDLEERIDGKIYDRQESIDSKLDGLLEKSIQQSVAKRENDSDGRDALKSKYNNTPELGRIDVSMDEFMKRFRQNLAKRKKVGDRLSLKTRLAMLVLKAFGPKEGLVQKIITNSAGRKQTVWVRPGENVPEQKPNKRAEPQGQKRIGDRRPTGLQAPSKGLNSERKQFVAKPAEKIGVVQNRHDDFERQAKEQRRFRGGAASIRQARAGDIVQIVSPKSRVRNQIGKVVQRRDDGMKVMMPNGIFQDFDFDELAFAKAANLSKIPKGIIVLKAAMAIGTNPGPEPRG
ncbi:MAG: hypothetical protein KDK37_05880 [Leptospiraceae bacterium]|nr:hypothetical protein [Leptospiraceae bacterium]